MKKVILACLILLSLCTLLICGSRLYSDWNDSVSANEQQGLKPAIRFPDILPEKQEEPVPGPTGTEGIGSIESIEDAQLQSDLPLMDFSGLIAKNSEIIAWLTIDGTNIDYPVAQAADNKYYLTHTAEKKAAKQGAIFMEFRNNRDFSDFSNILYGHNLQSGNMFGQLVKFKEKSFFDSHTTGTLYTPDKTYLLEIIACAVTSPTSDYYQYAFSSPAERTAHMQVLKSGATYWCDTEIDPEADKLLVLSTCSYEYKNARTVIIAKMPGGM
jgi:sortase B